MVQTRHCPRRRVPPVAAQTWLVRCPAPKTLPDAPADSLDSPRVVPQDWRDHIGQLDFHFPRRATDTAALQNILLARSSGLHHLIVSPTAAIYETLTKPHGSVVDNPCFLKQQQLLVTTMRWNEARSAETSRPLIIPRKLSHNATPVSKTPVSQKPHRGIREKTRK